LGPYCFKASERRCAIEIDLRGLVDKTVASASLRMRATNPPSTGVALLGFYVGDGSPDLSVFPDSYRLLEERAIARRNGTEIEIDVSAAAQSVINGRGYFGVRVAQPWASVPGFPLRVSTTSEWESVSGPLAARLTVHTRGVCADEAALLETRTTLGTGDASCPYGGTRIDRGRDNGGTADTLNDAVLGASEIDDTVVVCAAAPIVCPPPVVCPETITCPEPVACSEPFVCPVAPSSSAVNESGMKGQTAVRGSGCESTAASPLFAVLAMLMYRRRATRSRGSQRHEQ